MPGRHDRPFTIEARAIEPRRDRHARTETKLRTLQQTAAPRFTRRAHLQLRVHVLRDLRGQRPRQRLSQLRGRLRSPTGQAVEELERRQLSGKGPREHPDQAPAGRSGSSCTVRGCHQGHSATRAVKLRPRRTSSATTAAGGGSPRIDRTEHAQAARPGHRRKIAGAAGERLTREPREGQRFDVLDGDAVGRRSWSRCAARAPVASAVSSAPLFAPPPQTRTSAVGGARAAMRVARWSARSARAASPATSAAAGAGAPASRCRRASPPATPALKQVAAGALRRRRREVRLGEQRREQRRVDPAGAAPRRRRDRSPPRDGARTTGPSARCRARCRSRARRRGRRRPAAASRWRCRRC